MEKPRPKLLVVDDELDFLDCVTRFLQSEGYEVYSATDGLEGERLFNKHAPDLVIIDIIMPRQEGIETIITLRKVHPGLPIIAMSGGPWRKEYLRASQLLGANCVMEKPFGLDQFRNQINLLLKQN